MSSGSNTPSAAGGAGATNQPSNVFLRFERTSTSRIPELTDTINTEPHNIHARLGRALIYAENNREPDALLDLQRAETIATASDDLEKKTIYCYMKALVLCSISITETVDTIIPGTIFETAPPKVIDAINAANTALTNTNISNDQKLDIICLKIALCKNYENMLNQVVAIVRNENLMKLFDPLERADKKEDKKETFEFIAAASKALDDKEAELFCLNKILEADPKSIISLNKRAELYSAMHHWEEAIADLEHIGRILHTPQTEQIAAIRAEEFQNRWGCLATVLWPLFGPPQVHPPAPAP